MLKRLSIPTLILAIGIASIAATAISPPVEAMVKRDEILYWSFDEMVEFDAQMRAESDAACGSDEMCKEMYIYEQREKSDVPEKFRALEYFRGICRLIFYTINPTLDILNVYYMDKDDMMMGMMNAPSAIKEIYVAWVENSVPDPRWQAFWDGDDAITPYVTDMRNGIMSPGVHELYYGTSAKYGENWFTPYLKTTIDASGSHLKDNQNHLIHFTVLATNSGNMLGATDYSSCFEHGDYEEGMECRIMYSGTAWPVYFPAYPGEENPVGVEVISEPTPELAQEPTTEEPELTSEPELTTDPKPTTETGPAQEQSKPQPEVEVEFTTTPVFSTSVIRVPEVTTEVAVKSTSKTQDITSDTTSETPEILSAPETLEIPLAAKKEEHQFPWWIVVLIFSGITLVLWWFIPIKRRKKDEED